MGTQRTCTAQLEVQRNKRSVLKKAVGRGTATRGTSDAAATKDQAAAFPTPPTSPETSVPPWLEPLAAGWGTTEGSDGSSNSAGSAAALSLLHHLAAPGSPEDAEEGGDEDVDEDMRAMAAAYLEGDERQHMTPVALLLALHTTTLKLLTTHPCGLPINLPAALLHAGLLLPAAAADDAGSVTLTQHAAIQPGCTLLTLTALVLAPPAAAPLADAARALLRGPCRAFFGRVARDWTLQRSVDGADAGAAAVAHVRAGRLVAGTGGDAVPRSLAASPRRLPPLLPWALHSRAGGVLRCSMPPPPPSPGLLLRGVRCRVHGAYLPGVAFALLPRGGGIEVTLPRCASALDGCALFELVWAAEDGALSGSASLADAATVQPAAGWAVLLAASAPLAAEAIASLPSLTSVALAVEQEEDAWRVVLLLGHALHACALAGDAPTGEDGASALPLLRAAAGEAVQRGMALAAQQLLAALAAAGQAELDGGAQAEREGVALLLRCRAAAMRAHVLRAFPQAAVPWLLCSGSRDAIGSDDEEEQERAVLVECAASRVAAACVAGAARRNRLLRGRDSCAQPALAAAAARFAAFGDDAAASVARAALRAHRRRSFAFTAWACEQQRGGARVCMCVALWYSAVLVYIESDKGVDATATVLARGVPAGPASPNGVLLSFSDCRTIYFGANSPSTIVLRVSASLMVLVLASLAQPRALCRFYVRHHDALAAAHGFIQFVVCSVYVELAVHASLAGQRIVWPAFRSTIGICALTLIFALFQPLSDVMLGRIMLCRGLLLPCAGLLVPVWPKTHGGLLTVVAQAAAAAAGYAAGRARRARLAAKWRAHCALLGPAAKKSTLPGVAAATTAEATAQGSGASYNLRRRASRGPADV
jgi:hypothetical protein